MLSNERLPAGERGFRFVIFLSLIFLIIPSASLWLMEVPVQKVALHISSSPIVDHIYALDDQLYACSVMLAFPMGILPCLLVWKGIMRKRIAVAAWTLTVPLLESCVVFGKLLFLTH